MQPTVGRIVHYKHSEEQGVVVPSFPRAAIITQVWGQTALLGGWEPGDVEPVAEFKGEVGLAVVNPSGMSFVPRVPYSEEPKPGHWSWPPKD